MKDLKILALIALFLGAFGVNSALAQSDDDDPPPPMMSDYYEEGGSNESGNENQEDSYQNSVTIEGSESGTKESGDTYQSSSYSGSEQPERLRVYSGKHTGNNIISDPRRD